MLHAEAHERLADLALEPAHLDTLETDASPEAAALRAHLADCERCRADVTAWRRAWAELGASHAARDPVPEPIRAPASLRARTLEAAFAPRTSAPAPLGTAAEAARSHASAGQRARRLAIGRRMPWLVAAAALVIALGAGGLAWSGAAELQREQAANAELAAVATSFDRVLADPVHWVVPLRATDGAPGGTLAWSRTDLVVVSSVLPAPSDGRSYVCWVEHDGVRTPVGSMRFSGATGYWSGAMADWGADFAPGARFGVSLKADNGEAVPVLVGSL